jgi:preprotein translocase subunit SecD
MQVEEAADAMYASSFAVVFAAAIATIIVASIIVVLPSLLV